MTFRRLRDADREGFRLIHGRLRARRLDPVMIAATDAGTKSAAWLALSAVLAVFGGKKGRKTAAVTVAATLTAQAVVNVGMKPLVRRRRPFRRSRLRATPLVKPPREHSWPSGHAASSAAAVTTLIASYPSQAIPLALVGLAISYSRIYVGVHYPFDVAAGTAVGAAVGTAWVSAVGVRGSRFEVQSSKPEG
jgi:undecaprenyl-diphosphatase